MIVVSFFRCCLKYFPKWFVSRLTSNLSLMKNWWLRTTTHPLYPRRPKYPSCMFFQYNTQLGPPYHILVDTNFINFSIKAKLDVVQSMMDCLYAKCGWSLSCFFFFLVSLADWFCVTDVGFVFFRCSLHHRLCHGWAWETWDEIQSCFEVNKFLKQHTFLNSFT